MSNWEIILKNSPVQQELEQAMNEYGVKNRDVINIMLQGKFEELPRLLTEHKAIIDKLLPLIKRVDWG